MKHISFNIFQNYLEPNLARRCFSSRLKATIDERIKSVASIKPVDSNKYIQLSDIKLQEKREGFMKKKEALVNVTVYMNPIVSEMDKLIIACNKPEDVLTLQVTHRGAAFLHNLITSIKTLALVATENSTAAEVAAMYKDPRYDLLLGDLLANANFMDLHGMQETLNALKTLDHKYFKIFTAMHPILLKTQITNSADIEDFIKVSEAYHWAGFTDAPVIQHLASEISRLSKAAEATPLADYNEREIDGINSVFKPSDKHVLMALKVIVGHNGTFDKTFFQIAHNRFTRRLTRLENRSDVLNSSNSHSLALPRQVSRRELSTFALAFTQALQPEFSFAVERVGSYLMHEHADRSLWSPESCTAVCLGLHRMAVSSTAAPVLVSVCSRLVEELKIAVASGADVEWNLNGMTKILDAVAFFVSNTTKIDNNSSSSIISGNNVFTAEDLIILKSCAINLTKYMMDRIDQVGEGSATRMARALIALNLVEDTRYEFSFLWRKIGSNTRWEENKGGIFQLWLSQVIDFPFIEQNLPKRCITEGMRSWALARGGWGAPFYPEIQEMAALLTSSSTRLGFSEMDVELEKAIDGPYVVDIAFNNVKKNNTHELNKEENGLETQQCNQGLLILNEGSRPSVEMKLALLNGNFDKDDMNALESSFSFDDLLQMTDSEWIEKCRERNRKWWLISNGSPVGKAALQVQQMSRLGWEVVVIKRAVWRHMNENEKCELLKHLIFSEHGLNISIPHKELSYKSSLKRKKAKKAYSLDSNKNTSLD